MHCFRVNTRVNTRVDAGVDAGVGVSISFSINVGIGVGVPTRTDSFVATQHPTHKRLVNARRACGAGD